MSALYSAFDTFPAPKGAAVHIEHMAKALFKSFPEETHSQNLLYVLGGEGLPKYQRENGVSIHRFSTPIANYLHRAIAFSGGLKLLLEKPALNSKGLQMGEQLKCCHFRDPWSGLTILNYRHKTQADYKTVYEVNGLPSIELPYAYPHIAPSTLQKIKHQEQMCLAASDLVIVPSQIIAKNLMKMGVSSEKLTVIHNGAPIVGESYDDFSKHKLKRPALAPKSYLIYFGALQQWQGVDDLIRALPLLADYPELKLVICAAKHNRIAKAYRKLAAKLEIQDRIHWEFGLEQHQLQPWIANALVSIAPLTDCRRNMEQGCCPLKVLESMAQGVPVIASDLPVVHELMENEKQGLLIRPGRPADIARAVRRLVEDPQLVDTFGQQGWQRVKESFTWKYAEDKLVDSYKGLMSVELDSVCSE